MCPKVWWWRSSCWGRHWNDNLSSWSRGSMEDLGIWNITLRPDESRCGSTNMKPESTFRGFTIEMLWWDIWLKVQSEAVKPIYIIHSEDLENFVKDAHRDFGLVFNFCKIRHTLSLWMFCFHIIPFADLVYKWPLKKVFFYKLIWLLVGRSGATRKASI